MINLNNFTPVIHSRCEVSWETWNKEQIPTTGGVLGEIWKMLTINQVCKAFCPNSMVYGDKHIREVTLMWGSSSASTDEIAFWSIGMIPSLSEYIAFGSDAGREGSLEKSSTVNGSQKDNDRERWEWCECFRIDRSSSASQFRYSVANKGSDLRLCRDNYPIQKKNGTEFSPSLCRYRKVIIAVMMVRAVISCTVVY